MKPKRRKTTTKSQETYQPTSPAKSISLGGFRILIATDCHLGYNESHETCGHDSFNSFEEMLQIAKNENVDFILLGGDLFHDNNPTRYTLNTCISLLRKYCYGESNLNIEFVDPGNSQLKEVNFHDNNLNISIPVFSIHGNHDDPVGEGGLCSLNVLSSTGLVNYFGKYTMFDRIFITPIIFRKGETTIAIYGLGHIRDSVLHNLLLADKVHFDKSHDINEVYNILVLHQNRAIHDKRGYFPQNAIPDFIDLVFWGHEHECLIEKTLLNTPRTYITQPGSTVITALSKGETIPKHVGVLKVEGLNSSIVPIKLETAREFIIRDLDTKEANDSGCISFHERIKIFLSDNIQDMLRGTNFFLKPLLRIRLTYHGDETVKHFKKLGQDYHEKLANPDNVVLVRKHVEAGSTSGGRFKERTKLETNDTILKICEKNMRKLSGDTKPCILNIKVTLDRMLNYVTGTEKSFLNNYFLKSLSSAQRCLKNRNVAPENIKEEMIRYREMNNTDQDLSESDIEDVYDIEIIANTKMDLSVDSESDVEFIPEPKRSKRTRN